jgi:5'-3' exonuclease
MNKVLLIFFLILELLSMVQDIEKELGLNREKLIRMALLLGSDYTEGVRCGKYLPYCLF